MKKIVIITLAVAGFVALIVSKQISGNKEAIKSRYPVSANW